MFIFFLNQRKFSKNKIKMVISCTGYLPDWSTPDDPARFLASEGRLKPNTFNFYNFFCNISKQIKNILWSILLLALNYQIPSLFLSHCRKLCINLIGNTNISKNGPFVILHFSPRRPEIEASFC